MNAAELREALAFWGDGGDVSLSYRMIFDAARAHADLLDKGLPLSVCLEHNPLGCIFDPTEPHRWADGIFVRVDE